MIKATSVVVNDDYSVIVTLEDGRIACIDMNYIKNEFGPIVEPLKQLENFKKAFIRNGILCWPTGYDMDPYFLLESAVFIKNQKVS